MAWTTDDLLNSEENAPTNFLLMGLCVLPRASTRSVYRELAGRPLDPSLASPCCVKKAPNRSGRLPAGDLRVTQAGFPGARCRGRRISPRSIRHREQSREPDEDWIASVRKGLSSQMTGSLSAKALRRAGQPAGCRRIPPASPQGPRSLVAVGAENGTGRRWPAKPDWGWSGLPARNAGRPGFAPSAANQSKTAS